MRDTDASFADAMEAGFQRRSRLRAALADHEIPHPENLDGHMLWHVAQWLLGQYRAAPELVPRWIAGEWALQALGRCHTLDESEDRRPPAPVIHLLRILLELENSGGNAVKEPAKMRAARQHIKANPAATLEQIGEASGLSTTAVKAARKKGWLPTKSP